MSKPKSRTLREQELDLAADTLSGDLRDYFLEMLRHEKSGAPWNTRPEREQREVVDRVTSKVESIIRRAVELIAADGRKTIKAHVESVTVKEAIKATLLLPRSDEQRHELFDATGSDVLITVSDASAYIGERAPAPIVPDQADAFDMPMLPPPQNGQDRDLPAF